MAFAISYGGMAPPIGRVKVSTGNVTIMDPGSTPAKLRNYHARMETTAWAFYFEYARANVWKKTRWLGTILYKCPLDLWMYQEILFNTRPDVIIETGTYRGGSALYLASMCDLLDNGRIITVDIEEKEDRPEHPRILYLTGSSIAPEIVDRVKAEIADSSKVMVILDSDHHKEHVLEEMEAYGPLVSEGCYLIVEDTPTGQILPDFGPGPSDAIEEFLTSNGSFVIDPDCEKFLMTFQPDGYLKRLPIPG